MVFASIFLFFSSLYKDEKKIILPPSHEKCNPEFEKEFHK